MNHCLGEIVLEEIFLFNLTSTPSPPRAHTYLGLCTPYVHSSITPSPRCYTMTYFYGVTQRPDQISGITVMQTLLMLHSDPLCHCSTLIPQMSRVHGSHSTSPRGSVLACQDCLEVPGSPHEPLPIPTSMGGP